MPEAWYSSITLRFKQDRRGVTVMSGNEHTGPLMVQRPFYEGEVCNVYLLHPPGGVAGCDELNVSVTVEQGAHTLITTPGATKFYKTWEGQRSLFKQCLTVADGGSLEYLPQENIYFKGTKTRLDTEINLEKGGRFVFWDLSAVGTADEPEGRFKGSEFLNGVSVRRGGRLIFCEKNYLRGDEDLSAPAANHGCAQQGVLLSNRLGDESLEAVCALMEESGVYGAAANLDDLFTVRVLGRANEELRDLLVKIWMLIRPETVGFAPVPPRIWST